MRRVSFITSILIAAAWLYAGEDAAPQAVSAAEIAKNIKALNAEDFKTREDATHALIAADDAANPALISVLKSETDPEVRSRIATIRLANFRKHPERALKIRVEKPEKPLVAGSNDLLERVKVWIENTADQPITVCKSMCERAGNIEGDLNAGEPRYAYKLFDSKGKRVGMGMNAGGNHPYEPLDNEYFVTLKPGEKVQVLPAENRSHYGMKIDCPEPGTYSLAVEYAFTGKGNPDGIRIKGDEDKQLAAQQELGVQPEWEVKGSAQALKCCIVSERIKIEVVSKPSEK